jgi:hypothetical protein
MKSAMALLHGSESRQLRKGAGIRKPNLQIAGSVGHNS